MPETNAQTTVGLPLVVTDAGREAAIEADNDGLQLSLTEIALGDGLWQPDGTATALQNEIKRLDNLGGGSVAPDMLHLTITDDSTDEYQLGEFGLYTDTGILFALYSQTEYISEKIAESILMVSADIKLDTVPPESVTIEGNNFQYPPATETISGVSEVATQGEVDAGSDGCRFVVPAKLKAWWDSVRTWNNIKNKPSEYPPESHTHSHDEVEGLGTSAPLDAGQDDGQVALIGNPVDDGKTTVIVMSGKNANGNYRIWSDGYIEQWGKRQSYPASTTYPFPIPFLQGNTDRITLVASHVQYLTGTSVEILGVNVLSVTEFATVTPAGSEIGFKWYAAG